MLDNAPETAARSAQERAERAIALNVYASSEVFIPIKQNKL